MHGRTSRINQVVPTFDFEQKPKNKKKIYDLEQRKGIKPQNTNVR